MLVSQPLTGGHDRVGVQIGFWPVPGSISWHDLRLDLGTGGASGHQIFADLIQGRSLDDKISGQVWKPGQCAHFDDGLGVLAHLVFFLGSDLVEIDHLGSFRLGFSLILLVAIIALMVYNLAPRLAEAVPSVAPILVDYVDIVNDLRLWVDLRMQDLIALMNDKAGS